MMRLVTKYHKNYRNLSTGQGNEAHLHDTDFTVHDSLIDNILDFKARLLNRHLTDIISVPIYLLCSKS